MNGLGSTIFVCRKGMAKWAEEMKVTVCERNPVSWSGLMWFKNITISEWPLLWGARFTEMSQTVKGRSFYDFL